MDLLVAEAVLEVGTDLRTAAAMSRERREDGVIGRRVGG